jgi:hypothetical protein
LKEEIGILVSFDTFMEKESIVTLELGFLAFNIRKKIVMFNFIFL